MKSGKEMTRYASSRNTDAVSELERFLDDESDNLSPHLFNGLEEVAESIDKIANETLTEVQDLQSRLEDREERLIELGNTIDKLEEKIDELEESK